MSMISAKLKYLFR